MVLSLACVRIGAASASINRRVSLPTRLKRSYQDNYHYFDTRISNHNSSFTNREAPFSLIASPHPLAPSWNAQAICLSERRKEVSRQRVVDCSANRPLRTLTLIAFDVGSQADRGRCQCLTQDRD